MIIYYQKLTFEIIFNFEKLNKKYKIKYYTINNTCKIISIIN